MSNLVPLSAGGAPAIFAGRNLPDMNAAAQQGVLASFAIIGYKGRNWRIKYRGEDEMVKDAKGAPVPTLDVVIVGISPSISKQFYKKRYSEGDDAKPDCYSVNGVAPEPDSPDLQCQTCAACPQNVFGSRVSENGKKAKACQDSRRLAVVPVGDIDNDGYGGPMLLRLPPMSLSSLARYTNELSRFAAQPYMVRTTLSFDYDVAYPLITFKAEGWLDNAEATAVARQMENPLIERLLETAAAEAATTAQENTSALSGGAPASAFGSNGGLSPQEAAAAGARAAEAKARQDAAEREEQERVAKVRAAEAEREEAARRAAQRPNLDAEVAAVEAQAARQASVQAKVEDAQPLADDEEDEDDKALRAAQEAVAAAQARAAAKAAAKAAKDAGAAIPAGPSATTVVEPRKPFSGAAPVQAAAPAEDTAATTAKAAVKEAPPDLEAAIADLLA